MDDFTRERKVWLREEIARLKGEWRSLLEPGATATNDGRPVNKFQYIKDIQAQLKAHTRELNLILWDEWMLRLSKLWGKNV